ncbi:hypothetical protein BH18ACT1_BH18ACT1_02620 [soil metagenome]
MSRTLSPSCSIITTALSGSSVTRSRARLRCTERATRCCWAPSWRLRSILRRSWSALATMRARETCSSTAWARTSSSVACRAESRSRFCVASCERWSSMTRRWRKSVRTPRSYRVPGEHPDDHGRQEEEVVVDEDLERHRSVPHGDELVSEANHQRRRAGEGDAQAEHCVAPLDRQQDADVVQGAVLGLDDGDHGHDPEAGHDGQRCERRLHDPPVAVGEGEGQDGEGDRAVERPEQPDPAGLIGYDDVVEDPEEGVEGDRQAEGQAGEQHGVVEPVISEGRLEVVLEAEAAEPEPRAGRRRGGGRHDLAHSAGRARYRVPSVPAWRRSLRRWAPGGPAVSRAQSWSGSRRSSCGRR